MMTKTEKTDGNQKPWQFQKGQSGNPAGRPKGSRHAITIMAENLLDGQAEALIAKAMEMALAGDTAAMRICVDRIIPPRRDRPISFELPPISNAEQLPQAATALLQAVGDGEMSPEEAVQVMRLIEGVGKTIEMNEFEKRLRKLEGKM